MKRELHRASVPGIILLMMLGAAVARPQQPPSGSLESALRAREVLEAGIRAMGGLEALQALQNITRELEGVRSDQGQGARPYLGSDGNPSVTSTYQKATSIRDLRNQRSLEYRETAIFGGTPFLYRIVASPSLAFSTNDVTRTYRQTPQQAFPFAVAGAFRRYQKRSCSAPGTGPRCCVGWVKACMTGASKTSSPSPTRTGLC